MPSAGITVAFAVLAAAFIVQPCFSATIKCHTFAQCTVTSASNYTTECTEAEADCASGVCQWTYVYTNATGNVDRKYTKACGTDAACTADEEQGRCKNTSGSPGETTCSKCCKTEKCNAGIPGPVQLAPFRCFANNATGHNCSSLWRCAQDKWLACPASSNSTDHTGALRVGEAACSLSTSPSAFANSVSQCSMRGLSAFFNSFTASNPFDVCRQDPKSTGESNIINVPIACLFSSSPAASICDLSCEHMWSVVRTLFWNQTAASTAAQVTAVMQFFKQITERCADRETPTLRKLLLGTCLPVQFHYVKVESDPSNGIRNTKISEISSKVQSINSVVSSFLKLADKSLASLSFPVLEQDGDGDHDDHDDDDHHGDQPGATEPVGPVHLTVMVMVTSLENLRGSSNFAQLSSVNLTGQFASLVEWRNSTTTNYSYTASIGGADYHYALGEYGSCVNPWCRPPPTDPTASSPPATNNGTRDRSNNAAGIAASLSLVSLLLLASVGIALELF